MSYGHKFLIAFSGNNMTRANNFVHLQLTTNLRKKSETTNQENLVEGHVKSAYNLLY